MTEQVIVVTGHKYKDPNYGWFIDFDRSGSSAQPVIETWEGSGGGGSDILFDTPTSGDENDHSVSAAVNVKVTNQANLDQALKAAENIVQGLIRIESFLNNLPSDTPISWAGRTMTAGQALNSLYNTKFIVTDTPTNNGGVGSAEYGLNGSPNIDYLYFDSFDGDGDNDYAHPNYTDWQGIVGILLHEIGHMNSVGFDFRQESIFYFEKEFRTTNGFVGSEYWLNNEMFANDFVDAVARVAGISLGEYQPNEGFGAREPIYIYNDNRGNAPYIYDDGLIM